MYCTNCGNQLTKASKFCSNCGQKFIEAIPSTDTNHNLSSTQNFNDDVYIKKLKWSVTRTGGASIIYGLMNLLGALVFPLLYLTEGVNESFDYAFASLIFVFQINIGMIFILLGKRILRSNDIRTKRYLIILLFLLIFGVLLGTGLNNATNGNFGIVSIGTLILIVLVSLALSAWGKLQYFTEFRNNLSYQFHFFSGPWWAVLFVPSILIAFFSVMILTQ